MSLTENAPRTRTPVRSFFIVVVGLWLFGVVVWSLVSLDLWGTAQEGVCSVAVDEGSGTSFVVEAEWQSWPQPGVLCRSTVQWHGQEVELIETRPVPLASAALLGLWGATLIVLRPRRRRGSGPTAAA